MSHSILDDFDFDVQSIRLHTPYVTKNPKFLGLTTTNSTIAASEALNHVLFDVDKQIENIILESKLPGVSVNFLSNILNLIVLVETNEPANHPSTISPDEEPLLGKGDTWGRSQLNAHKRGDEVVQKSLPEPTKPLFDEVKSMAKFKEQAKAHLKQIQPNQLPIPVNLRYEEEIPKEEEKMRQEKELKLQKIQNEQLKRKKEEAQLNELRAKFFKQDEIQKKRFTYDFDGKILTCNPLNPEKLPMAPVLVGHQVEKNDHGNKRRNVGLKQVFHPQPQKNPLQEVDAGLSGIYVAPNIFDHLDPKAGVMVKKGGLAKRGFNFSGLTADSSLPSLGSTMTNWNKLTRGDYESLVKAGLSQRQSMIKLEDTNGSRTPSVRQTPRGFDRSPASKFRSGSSPMNKLRLDGRGDQSPFHIETVEETERKPVKVHSSKLLETLLQPGVESVNFSKGRELRPMTERSRGVRGVTIDESQRKTPVDEFNMNILTASNWGKGGSQYIEPQNPLVLPKKHYKQQLSLGNISFKGAGNQPNFTGTFYSTKSNSSGRNRWGTSSKPVSRNSTYRDQMYF